MYTKIHSITMQRNTAAEREIKLACFFKNPSYKNQSKSIHFFKVSFCIARDHTSQGGYISSHITTGVRTKCIKTIKFLEMFSCFQ